MKRRAKVVAVGLVLLTVLQGCGKEGAGPDSGRREAVDEVLRQRWGKSLDQLDTIKFIAISPHNTNIQNEFEWAFSLHHAIEFGEKVDIEWRDVGGGGGAILGYLRNVYARNDSCGIDIIWGGGEYVFGSLAGEGLLEQLELSQDILSNMPAEFGGLAMYDPQLRWCGAAVSGFGFIYNAPLLGQLGLEPPGQWEDLAEPKFFELICLADPTQSGSVAAVYEMIVQSGQSWPDGWARLLAILGNAKKFLDSAGAAAEAPGLGEAPVATCIDFYGTMRVAGAPQKLVYISPEGQTAFTPDPIGILKGAPHVDLAQRFVDFVMSARGQAIWALRVGEPHGPVRNELGRQPIRRDVYETYKEGLSSWVVDPYQTGNELQVDTEMQRVRFGVLRQLVRAAAIDNHKGLLAARRQLIAKGFPPELVAEFNALPPNVGRREQIAEMARSLRDAQQSELIVTNWIKFFREKYDRIAR